MHILLLEDELLIQMALKRFMEKKGAKVYATSSGREAISQLKKKKFDKVICDLILPDLTGIDVIEESKSKYSKEDIRRSFILITAYVSHGILDEARTYGCKIFRKPFEDIKEVVDYMVEDAAMRQGR